MGKNSRKRDAERKAKRQDWALKQLQSNAPNIGKSDLDGSSGLIPQFATLGPDISDLLVRHTKEGNYKLIFATYNHNECEISLLQNTKDVAKLIRLFNRITECNQKDLSTAGIVRDKINKGSSYESLFKTIPPDTELLEAEYTQTGRLFFYIYQTYFCIVTVKVRHVE